MEEKIKQLIAELEKREKASEKLQKMSAFGTKDYSVYKAKKKLCSYIIEQLNNILKGE